MPRDDDLRKIVENSYKASKNEIIANTRILIFGPGPGSDGFELREGIREAVEELGAQPSYAENVLEGTEMNAVLAEKILIGQVDLVFVLLAGIGTSSEFSTYIQKESIAAKFRVFQDAKYIGKASFLNQVMELFCGRFRHCYRFKSKNELKRFVKDCLKYHALWRMAHG